MAQTLMGYCPQYDAFDGMLTCREHLLFFTRIRGFSSQQQQEVSKWEVMWPQSLILMWKQFR